MKAPPFLLSLANRLPLTREGLGWLVLTVAILSTGLVKGINLITLLACLFLAVGLMNLLLAWRQVRGVQVHRDLPDFLLAQTAASWPLTISQKGRRRRYSLVVIEGWRDANPAIVDLKPDRPTTIEAHVVAPRRGLVTLGPALLQSTYPFGLALFERRAAPPTTVPVAPRLGILQRGLLRRWLSQRQATPGAVRSRPIRHPTGQSEFHGLRTFRPGDSPRLIHWRTSARRGELMVREFEEYPNDDLVLIVDLSLADPGRAEDFERMLSLAATIAWEWCRQKGDWLTVALAGASTRRIAGATNAALRADVMQALAAAGPIDVADADSLLNALHTPTTAHLLLSVGASMLLDPLSANLRHVLATVDVGAGEEREFFNVVGDEPAPAVAAGP